MIERRDVSPPSRMQMAVTCSEASTKLTMLIHELRKIKLSMLTVEGDNHYDASAVDSLKMEFDEAESRLNDILQWTLNAWNTLYVRATSN
jgi:hypothetical protein